MPWTRLLVEGVVVVASILLALAVDAWWSDRQAEVTRQEWLAALEVDFETNAAEADTFAMRSAADRVLAQRLVVASAEDVALIPGDSAWSYLRAIWRPNPAPLNTEAIVAALEAAPVLIAEDDELRRAVGAWRSSITYLRQFDETLWEIQDLAHAALANYPELQRAFADFEGPGATSTLPSGILATARADTAIMNLAARKVMYAALQLRFLEDVASAARDVNDVVRAARSR